MCCEKYFVKIDHLNYVFVIWLQNNLLNIILFIMHM